LNNTTGSDNITIQGLTVENGPREIQDHTAAAN